MSRRTWLVSVSIVGHLAVGVGLFASGIWKLEKLDNDSRMAGIGIMTPMMSSGGSPADLPAPKFQKKEKQDKKIAKNVQWDKRVERADKPAISETSDEPGNGEGKGKGPNTGDDIGPPSGVACAMPPCVGDLPALPEPPTPPDPPKPKTVSIPPQVMTALRTSGETQIHPSRNVKNQIIDDRKAQVVGTLKVCIQASGAIASATMLSSTKYPEYDQQLVEAVRRWHYRPYLVNGVPTPACSAVSFVYSIK